MSSTQGHVQNSYPDLIYADGLEEAGLWDVVEIEGSGLAIITALRRDRVELVPLTSTSPPSLHAPVMLFGPLRIPTKSLEGRVLSCHGEPLDGGCSFDESGREPVFAPDARGPEVDVPFKRLTTGFMVYDLNHVFRRGSAVLIEGPPSLVDHIVLHQSHAGSLCIDARSIKPSKRPADPCGANTIRLEPGNFATQASSWLAPWVAMRIAASYSKRGFDVLVILDSLESWLLSQGPFHSRGGKAQQLGVLTSKVHSSETGSVSFLAHHPERAPSFVKLAFDNRIDGWRCLQGAVDHRRSKLCRPPIQVDDMNILGQCIVALAIVEEWSLAPGLFPNSQSSDLRVGLRLRAHLQFRPGMTSDSVESLITLIAVFGIDTIEPAIVPMFLDRLLAELRTDGDDILKHVRSKGRYSKDDRIRVDVLAKRVSQNLGK